MPPRKRAAVPAGLVAFASALADATGPILRKHFRAGGAVEDKADGSPVTQADRAAERALRRRIRQAYPDHGIRGEEFGDERTDAEYLWVLDPIDGTRSFLSGKPVFTTLIGLLRRGNPVLGVIDQPVTRERWVGAAGKATWNGRAAKVRPCKRMADAVHFTTGPEWYKGRDKAAYQRLTAAVRMTMYSTDAYAFGLVASGHADLVVEAGLQPHDFCALIPVIEGAGGIITDWQGGRPDPHKPCNIVAAGDVRVHREALTVLGAPPKRG